MHNKIGIKSLCLILILFGSSNAMADSYWGIGLGSASFSIKPLYGTFTVEDGTAFKIFGGSRNNNAGMEVEFSTSSHDWVGSGGQATHKASNLILSGVGYVPIDSNMDLYGKIGINMWSTTVDFLGASYEGENGFALALGAGLNIATSNRFDIRLEYQAMNGLDDGIDSGNITQFTVNGAYHF